MRAVHYRGGSRLEVATAEPRPPRAGEVQVQVAYTGICGTDLHIFRGHMDTRVSIPAILGHEMSGRVAALGSDVEGWQVGDLVTVFPLQSCQRCPACRAGHGHVCHDLVFLGIDVDGAMQGYWTLPVEKLVRLPDNLPLESGALVEPLAVAVHDVARADVCSDDRVLVVGGGPVGMLIALVVQAKGNEVVISEPGPVRRNLAEQAGIATVDPSVTDVEAFVDDWTRGAGADVVFEVSGTPSGIRAAAAPLKVRGTLTLVGLHTEPRSVDLFRFFWRELTLVGARLYDRPDFAQAVTLIHQGRIDVATLISGVEPMDHVTRAFTVLERGEVMKVLIDCQR